MTLTFQTIQDDCAFWLVIQNTLGSARLIWLTLGNRSHKDGKYFNCLLVNSEPHSAYVRFNRGMTDLRVLSHTTKFFGPEEWK